MSKWSDKYKKSIDCDNPKGFSQKAHCAGRKKNLKELREYMGVTYGVGIGPVSTLNPMASMGSQGQLFPQYKGTQTSKQAGIYSQRGVGTYKPMVTAAKYVVPYKGSKNIGKQSTPGGLANIAKQVQGKVKVDAKDKDSAERIVKRILTQRMNKDKLRRFDVGVPLAVNEKDNPRIPRKKGQPAGSDKHSDLYTDENPKGTIHGLGFTDKAKAKQSVSKIRGSGKTHAHKMQAAIAMGQRAKVASVRAKDPVKKKNLRQAYKVYQSYIDKNKKSKD